MNNVTITVPVGVLILFFAWMILVIITLLKNAYFSYLDSKITNLKKQIELQKSLHEELKKVYAINQHILNQKFNK